MSTTDHTRLVGKDNEIGSPIAFADLRKPATLRCDAPDGRLAFTLAGDGVLTLGPGFDAGAAAAAFVEGLRSMLPPATVITLASSQATDDTRQALAGTVLSAHWPDGGLIDHLTRKTSTFVADAILASPWLAAHIAAVAEGKDAELGLALEMLQQIRDEADPTSPALVDSMVHAMVDGSCDLADRDPGREVWDQAREDITLVLPVVREAISGALAAERERIATAIAEVRKNVDFATIDWQHTDGKPARDMTLAALDDCIDIARSTPDGGQ